MKINPFEPQSPITIGMFVGRIPEIEKLESYLQQTTSGHPSNFIIHGERGIGKSSLLIYTKAIAEGVIGIVDNKLNLLVVDIDIDTNTSQRGLISRIQLGLEHKLAGTEPARKLFAEVWSFLQRVEAAGVKISPSVDFEADEILFDHFIYAFIDTVQRLTNKKDIQIFNASYDGVVILIDEADRASRALNLGTFLKQFIERLKKNDCVKVMIGLAGLSSIRKVLMESHESALRSFDELELERLNEKDINYAIDLGLKRASEENHIEFSITEKGRSIIQNLSEGYPHFIQQFCYSAFEQDTDDTIDEDDVLKGALGKHGALSLIGERYYRNDFYNKIQKESYRQVLRIMANKLNDWISKKEIREKFKGGDTVLDNALRALIDRNIIIPKEGERGVYRLQQKGFALWITYYTTDPNKLQQELSTKTE
jgi:predicted transcriptional regulator